MRLASTSVLAMGGVVLLVSGACAIVSPTAPLTPSGADLARVEGNWTGTTSQGKPIAFTVKAGSVTTVVVSFRVDQPGCARDVADDQTFPYLALKQGVDRPLWFLGRYRSHAADLWFELSGAFASSPADDASGSLTVTVTGCAGETRVKWTAAKSITTS